MGWEAWKRGGPATGDLRLEAGAKNEGRWMMAEGRERRMGGDE